MADIYMHYDLLDSHSSVLTPASVLTIGTFDGVHRGHQLLIGTVVRRAQARGVAAVVVTFDPHPRAVLAPESAPPRLTRIEDEVQLIAALGVNAVIVHPFTRATADTSAREFVGAVVRAVHPAEVWVGEDFALGRGREGTPDALHKLGAAFGYELHVLPRLRPNGTPSGGGDVGETIGSTAIRRHLLAGEAADAARLLGRPYTLTGPVVHGAKRGREIGYPTANVQVPPGVLVPKNGIYATWVTIPDDPTPPDHRRDRYPAMTYIGPRPVFDNGPNSVETHLIGWDGDLYDREIGVQFVGWLRGDASFDGVDALVAQMRRDEAHALDVLDAERSAFGVRRFE